MKRVYFDYNATTPVLPEARDALLPFLGERFGNPSSSHWAGEDVRPHVEEARRAVASLINAEPSEIVFTAGGSEGDNMALRGAVRKKGRQGHIITTSVEHPAVYRTCRLLEGPDMDVTYIPVDGAGMVEPKDVEKAIRKDTALISVMFANNETGNIFPMKEIARIARSRGIIFHTDAVQAVGKIPIDVKELDVDILTASGHKFYAPKGTGFQYVRKGAPLSPIITGGEQEGGMRAGTENVPGIVALGKACEVAALRMDEWKRHVGPLRERLERGILDNVPETSLNGHPSLRIFNTLNVSFGYVEGDALLDLLNAKGIAASTGSACASGSSEPSRVLTAMGLEPLRARGAIRFSLGSGNTEEDVDYCLEVLPPIARRLLEMSPYGRK